MYSRNEFLLVPNLLSYLRILLIFPLCYFLVYDIEKKVVISMLLIIIYITDILDGFVARRYNQISEIGKIVDPLADKLTVSTIIIILFISGKIPIWFFIIVLFRDLLILIFSFFLKKDKKVVLMSNFAGKITVFTIGLVLFLVIINSDNELLNLVISFLYYISVLLIIYSSVIYFKRFLKIKEGN